MPNFGKKVGQSKFKLIYMIIFPLFPKLLPYPKRKKKNALPPQNFKIANCPFYIEFFFKAFIFVINLINKRLL